MKKYIGIDIGGTTIKHGVLNESGQILIQGQTATKRDDGADIIEKVVEVVKGYQHDHDVSGVGISAPGAIRDDGYMITGGAILDFYDINLKEVLEAKIGLPVTLENDANCAALAELWQGSGRGMKHFLTVVVGTGIGGGIVVNGRLFKGANFNAGEFGYMLVEPIQYGDTRRASLSLTGAIGLGLVERYELRTQLTGHDGKAIFELADAGDVAAIGVVDGFYKALVTGLFNLATTFDPEVILIGGAISGNVAFMEQLNLRLRDLQAGHKDMGSVKLPEIKACQFENDAGMIGAVYNIHQALHNGL
jgi:predicted NBD/HSP70 family sugar kinase